MDDEKFLAILNDLPDGMRTWIWENAEDVVAALLCLKEDPIIFRMVVATGKLEYLRTQKEKKS